MFVHLQSRDSVLWMSFQRSAMSRIRINYRLHTLMKKSKIKICILWLNSAILLSHRRCIDFFATVVNISFRKLENFIPFRSVPRIIIKKIQYNVTRPKPHSFLYRVLITLRLLTEQLEQARQYGIQVTIVQVTRVFEEKFSVK